MAKNTITLEIPQLEGIAEKLGRILAVLENRPAPECERCVDSVAEFVDDRLRQNGLEPAQEDAVAPVQETQDTDPTPEEKPAETPTVARADVQKKVVALSAAGKRDAVKAVVMAYARNVSGIPEDKLAEVMDKLTALEG